MLHRSLAALAIALSLPACDAVTDMDDADLGPTGKADTVSSELPTVEARPTDLIDPIGTCYAEKFQFRVTYRDPSAQWGSRVILHRGFRLFFNNSDEPNGGHAEDWEEVKDAEMTASGPFTWTATTEVATWFGGSVEAIQFAFLKIAPSGAETWDTGGRDFGYYGAGTWTLGLDLDCDNPPGFEKLVVGTN